MQGWRTSQEDAHTAEQLDEDTFLFGVFDGHGGKETSIFVSQMFGEELKMNEKYKKGNFQEALEETCMKMDIMMQ